MFRPVKGLAFLRPSGKWKDNRGVAADESSIEIGKSEKALDFLQIRWLWPIRYGDDLGFVYRYAISRNDKAGVLDCPSVRIAILLSISHVALLLAVMGGRNTSISASVSSSRRLRTVVFRSSGSALKSRLQTALQRSSTRRNPATRNSRDRVHRFTAISPLPHFLVGWV